MTELRNQEKYFPLQYNQACADILSQNGTNTNAAPKVFRLNRSILIPLAYIQFRGVCIGCRDGIG